MSKARFEEQVKWGVEQLEGDKRMAWIVNEARGAMLDHLINFKFRWYDVLNPFSVFRLSEHIRNFLKK